MRPYIDLLLHPMRFANFICRAYEKMRLEREAKRNNVKLVIGRDVHLTDCHLRVRPGTKNITLVIGDKCILKHGIFEFHGSDSTICVGEGTCVNALKAAKTSFMAGEHANIQIGEDCLFANGIIACTCDFHSVYNEEGKRINPDRDITIGEHVWVGRKSYICKGTSIAKNSVVGACSVVAKAFEQENCVIAGNPAAVKKVGITWDRKNE